MSFKLRSLVVASLVGGISPFGCLSVATAQTPAMDRGSLCDTMPECEAGCDDALSAADNCDSLSCDDLGCAGGDGRSLLGFKLGGWVAAGTTINSRHPQNPSAGFGNLPVTFNYRDRALQLNQLYLNAERAVDGSGGLDFGGRVDFLYGEDYIFTQAIGLETRDDGSGHWNNGLGGDGSGIGGSNRNGIAMPQAYGEVAYGNLSAKIGHFYTIIGNETVTATGNFFYSHAYTMQYGEPFTHTGILGKWVAAERLTVYSGIVNGWDKFDAETDRASYLGGASWVLPNEATTLNFGIITGDEDGTAPPIVGNRTMYSFVLGHQLNEKLNLILQHDLGVQQNGSPDGADAQWYGINSYLLYALNERWKAGMRYEWFNDDDGTRVVNEAGSFQEITTGLNWTPCDRFMLRPETRWDWFDPNSATAVPGPYDNFNKRSQFTLAVDAIVTF